ncbi:Beta-glucosidase 12 [Citrus sinensis]|uniref:Beta-glucosidase 12 n=1 Tax=Citrus sinensis TaxID=2711 RepID=A0ACB8LM76_CITSI|nr:Beta-glucosidase 12 [Citrus sinensis]
MGIERSLVGGSMLLVVVALLLAQNRATGSGIDGNANLNRTCFPKEFIFGTAASSYQYEGAAAEDGRGPSIWDTFTHKFPDRTNHGDNGDVAVDFYHRYKEDVKLMKEMNLDAFRFSTSWSRILPRLQPFVTLFHGDLPQGLEDEYGGFLSPRIVDDFSDFADLCFKEFGDRVKHWITLNEPHSYSTSGYSEGNGAPGRCSKYKNQACQAGDSSTEPYLAGYHQLLAHAAAVEVYKRKYQANQKGVIGITLNSHWFVPYSNEKPDVEAAQRALDFMLGWYMDPVINGDYPLSMRTLVKERLPKFTEEQSARLKGSFDFIGMNYYTSYYARNNPVANTINISYTTDSLANLTAMRNGKLIGPQAASNWLFVYPSGFRDLLIYIKEKYSNPTLYITENGMDEVNNASLPLEEALKDPMRVDYYNSHLSFLQIAMKEGVNVKGYFAWSLLDNFEWSSAYSVRFGINFIDYKNGLKRYPKQSAIWFKNFLNK